jgi:hypothetical protein
MCSSCSTSSSERRSSGCSAGECSGCSAKHSAVRRPLLRLSRVSPLPRSGANAGNATAAGLRNPGRNCRGWACGCGCEYVSISATTTDPSRHGAGRSRGAGVPAAYPPMSSSATKTLAAFVVRNEPPGAPRAAKRIGTIALTTEVLTSVEARQSLGARASLESSPLVRYPTR